MAIHRRECPPPVGRFFASKPAWMWPVLAVEWPFAWMAYALGHWSAVEVFEYIGKFSVLVAVVFYFTEAPNRVKQKHYQAWQVINTAQHMGGSGGRIEALGELNQDGVPLIGVDVSNAFLQGVHLPKANLLRANFAEADVRDGNLAEANLSYASLRGANLRQSQLNRADLNSADLTDADLCGSRLNGADLNGAILDGADLGNASIDEIQWQKIKSIKNANVADIKNPPAGFVQWALKHGAIEQPANESCPAGANDQR